MTNADKIRAMSDEELAPMIAGNLTCVGCPASEVCRHEDACSAEILNWLRQEVKDE